ncbi:O-antigen polysaccharide polymerase Wzy [Paratractidigestivibacter sp.]|uniref:O-antigen polysaccharide polymerase Wzy n=1 Tax=Paratractidigestivibacter sp. TaxID=2847316 RepID=UPI002ACB13C3|nr:O-antigen polysaccharide polymerase Wzy [Paratractidigestivibacter sp.]
MAAAIRKEINNGPLVIKQTREKGHARVIALVTQLCLFMFTLLLTTGATRDGNWDDFIFWCRYGTVVAIASILLYAAVVGRFMTPMMLVMLSFVSFQFGIPILYGFIGDFTNWYVQSLQTSYLVAGTAFTVVCMQAFVLGASFAHQRKSLGRKPNALISSVWLSDSRAVTKIAAIGFVAMGIVAFPRAIMFLKTSLVSGIRGARAAYELGGIENIARGLFVPFGLILLVYLPKGRNRNSVFAVLALYSLLAAFSGDRTEGLTLMTVLVFYLFGNGTSIRSSIVKSMGIFMALLAITWMLVFIASARVGGSTSGISIGDSIVSALNEMGFNSLTIGFQMSITNSVSYGLGYLSSLSSLIPTSLDFFGFKTITDAINPVNQYYEVMGYRYNWASFGLGYSLVAESYSNFGYFGWVAIALLGALVEKLMGWNGNARFERYLSLVFLWSFLTLPRRSTAWLVNSFEWNLLFMALILWLWYKLYSTRRPAITCGQKGGTAQ